MVTMKSKKMLRRWDAIASRLDLTQHIVGAEVGVWQGKMSEQLFLTIPNLFLYLVDRWCVTPKGDSYFDGSIKLARLGQQEFNNAYTNTLKKVNTWKGKYSVLKMESVEAAKNVKDGCLDFCFLDGDHSYEGVTRDIKAWYPKIKSGGWICGHDYAHEMQGKVKEAVHDMLGYNIEVDINRTWFYQVV